MTEQREGYSRRKPRIKSPASQFMIDPGYKAGSQDALTQLVLDPEAKGQEIKALLAKRPTNKRVGELKTALDQKRFSELGQPNPLERRTR